MESRRLKIWSQIFVLGILLILPVPSSLAAQPRFVFEICVWWACLALGFSNWYFPNLRNPLWAVSFFLSLFFGLKFGGIWPALMLGLWRIWLSKGEGRIFQNQKNLNGVSLFLVFAFVGQVIPNSSAQTVGFQARDSQKALEMVEGFKLKDLTSCGIIDKIPWKFRPDGRKARLLIKDELRFQSETGFETWELFQIMDREGFVSYVFRHTLASGRLESIIIKDTVYNRVIETPKGNKTVESQSLKSLVNRQALAFYHSDGSSIVYSPSSVGRSSLTIQQGQLGAGRLLPPVFLRGNYCDRPDDEEDSDNQSRRAVQASPGSAPTAPAAGAAGGSTSR